MLESLANFEPEVGLEPPSTPVDAAAPAQIADAQANVTQWLAELGVDDAQPADDLEKAAARKAFAAITTTGDLPAQREALMGLHTPAAVRHLTAVLTAYDWEFVHHAKQLRGYVVAQLMEESKNPKAEIRLKALQTLGKVTEVGLFTEKVEITKKDMTDEEIDARIKDKLAKFMGVVDAVDVSDVDIKDGGEP